MITNIYLVRHAHSTYTPDERNRPLSEKGFKDAERVTELLSGKNITRILSSPYQRAIQTVEGIAGLSKADIIIDEGFRERKLAGCSVDNFDEAILQAWLNPDCVLPGGESSICAQARGVQSIKNTIKAYCGENIAIGTHGNIMVLIMNYYDERYSHSFWNSLKMPDIYQLSFENQSLLAVKSVW